MIAVVLDTNPCERVIRSARLSHSAWNFGSGPDDFYAVTSFS